jgi:LPPG:FO 2-phospho-L-lactate transferase
MSMLVVLSGGTGTPKLLQGLKEILPENQLVVIVNTAEDEWLPHGYFSPDVDTVMYTLADKINEETWYGIKGDSFITHKTLKELGYDEILNIGDRDRATHIQRGVLLSKGMRLSRVIELQKKALGVKAKVYPMSNDRVQTIIQTPLGEMNLHTYLIRYKGKLKVNSIYFHGIGKARPLPSVLKALANANGIIIGPSNPISSILPILSIKGIKKAIRKNNAKCVAISPIIGTNPVSGPADKFMEAMGFEVSPVGVAKVYSGIISKFIINSSDDSKAAIENLGVECYETNIIMRSLNDKTTLASFILELLN